MRSVQDQDSFLLATQQPVTLEAELQVGVSAALFFAMLAGDIQSHAAATTLAWHTLATHAGHVTWGLSKAAGASHLCAYQLCAIA